MECLTGADITDHKLLENALGLKGLHTYEEIVALLSWHVWRSQVPQEKGGTTFIVSIQPLREACAGELTVIEGQCLYSAQCLVFPHAAVPKEDGCMGIVEWMSSNICFFSGQL